MMMRTAVSAIALMGTSLGLMTGAASAQDGMERAQAMIDQYRALPEFTAPGEPFDARACADGVRMLAMPNNSSNPFLSGIIERMITAGEELGMEVTEWENQGQPSQWVQGMEFAVRDGYDIVNLISGINPNVIEPQIEAAAEAGVRTTTAHFYDPTQEPNPLLSSALPVSFNTIGQILANWVIVQTGGDAQIVIVQSDEVPPTEPLVAGILDTLEANCPDCEVVQQINVGITEWGTAIQPSVQSALLANPGVDYVIPIYDSMSQFVVPAIEITGRGEEVKIATFNGTPFVLDYIQEGRVEMDIGESLDWIARATVDANLRDICGLEVPDEINVPFYIFDASNVEAAGVPAQYDQGYGDDYLAGFRRVWMMDE